MLQRVQAEIGQARGVRVSVDAEHSAFFAEFIFPNIYHRLRLSRLRAAFNPDLSRVSDAGQRKRIGVITMHMLDLGRIVEQAASLFRLRFSARNRLAACSTYFWCGISLIAFLVSFVLVLATPSSKAASGADTGSTFNAKCATCHGRDGRGQTARGRRTHTRDLTDASWQNDVSDERLFNSIHNGRSRMPAFKKTLSESEIDALVTYVRQLRR
jgi:mono/diheme cytochrome c family protein